MEKKEIKTIVRQGYGRIAQQGSACCGPARSCCGSAGQARDLSKKIGYSDQELDAVPQGANLGLGCGNPVALASLREGETVLDLGSGAGFDAFLAANIVGKGGRVIGVDMTPEMIDKAQENARKGHYTNVEFRLGEIEKLPVADGSADVILSNCVINLSPDKSRVFQEAFRVLKPGGRLMISDIVLLGELPRRIQQSREPYIGCLSGAVMRQEYLRKIEAAGFREIEVVDETPIPVEFIADAPARAASVKVRAVKPGDDERRGA